MIERTVLAAVVVAALVYAVSHIPIPFKRCANGERSGQVGAPTSAHTVEFASKRATSPTIVDIKPVEHAASPAGKA
ncbi:MAG TPA: hypothetical protein VE958_04355, partial [Bryobacteraceae bacterium]|nr:hypothetical protein [Bryobacteraceae bacterium]